MNAETLLIAAVIKGGLEDPEWARGPCARWWYSLSGLDPAAMWNAAGYKVGDRSRNRERLGKFKPGAMCRCGADDHELFGLGSKVALT